MALLSDQYLTLIRAQCVQHGAYSDPRWALLLLEHIDAQAAEIARLQAAHQKTQETFSTFLKHCAGPSEHRAVVEERDRLTRALAAGGLEEETLADAVARVLDFDDDAEMAVALGTFTDAHLRSLLAGLGKLENEIHGVQIARSPGESYEQRRRHWLEHRDRKERE